MADNTTTPPMTTTTPPRERETVIDDRVVALRGLFPDFDDAILQSVLDSAGGNQDRAIDILLGMTDPSFKSESEPTNPQPAEPPVLSQTDLDEQFARQLVMQEQQQQTQLWLQSHPDQARPPPGVYHSSRPYNQYQSPQQQGAAAAERPSEFQEQVTKIAESGKKTFANIFSKVKAKIQEFETGRPSSSSPGAAPYPPYATHPSQQYQHPQPQTWSQSQSQAAYFDPNPTSSTPPNAPSTSPPPASSSTPPVQGYDVGVSSTPPTTTTTTTQLQREPSPQLPSTSSASVPTTTTIATPSQGAPASTNNPPIDAGKLGLMPKRPVSLIRDPAPAGTGTGTTVGAGAAAHLLDDNDDNDDGLEYAENPFDDEHGHSAAGKK